jgi:hypothetical protein
MKNVNLSVCLFDATGANEQDRMICSAAAVKVIERFGLQAAEELHKDFLEKLDDGDNDAETWNHDWCKLEDEANDAATKAINKRYFQRRSGLSDWFGDGAHLEFSF